MIVPKKWGQGALFAFSALDGASYATDDMTGMLCGDRIGVRFFTNVKRELAVVNVRGKNLEYDAVTSDYIRFAFPEQPAVRIIYAKAHLVVGNVAGIMEPAMFTEGRHKTEIVGDVEIHATADGDFSALAWTGDRFAFAYAHNREEVLKLAEERAEARARKDWGASDRLRDQIQALGFSVEDTREGQKIGKL